MTLRRLDTLFVRLFLLMWVTLVASHLVAFALSMPLGAPELAGGRAGIVDRLLNDRLPTLPSLPPGGPFGHMGAPPGPRLDGAGPGGGEPGQAGGPRDGRGPGLPGVLGGPPGQGMQAGPRGPGTQGGPRGPVGQQGLPAQVLWLDYGLRAFVIGLGAVLGARWLSAPMRRLSQAAQALSAGLVRGQPPVPMDEGVGTLEVRAAAQVFNTMALQLQQQF